MSHSFVVGMVTALVLSGCASTASPSPSLSGEQSVHQTATRRGPVAKAPRRPPARICGSKGLDGPATRPAGARRVTPSQDLQAIVEGSPRGTTFWLTPGRHHLDRGQFAQLVPKPRQRFIGAPGAIIDGRGTNKYAFGGQAAGVTVVHLTIQNFVAPHNEGVVNHDSGNGWQVRHNTIRRNGGAGVFMGDGSVVAHNCLARNGQYGFSAYEPDGVRGVVLKHNEVVGNNTDNWEDRIEDCGCSGGGKFWDTRNARIVRNWIHDNSSIGLWADTNNTGFLVRGNHISGNDSEGFIYETSYNARIVGNTFARNARVDGRTDRGFPMAALYLSESGSDRRAGDRYGRRFVVARNRFIDNWSGIMAWENADRFAGSPANTSSGYTTLANPGVATLENCSDPDLIGTDPYYDDCRWKTKNLRIHHNLFRFRPARIGDSCTAARACGFMGLVSQWGSYPEWSPYQGDVVERAVTFRQNNLWRSNRYVGPWRFQGLELGNVVRWATWRGPRFKQDRGSTWRRR